MQSPAAPRQEASPGPTREALLSVLDRCEFGLALLGANGEVTLWNDWLALRSQVPAASALGRRLDEIFPDLAGMRLVQVIDDAIARNQSAFISRSLNRAPLPLFEPGERLEGARRLEQSMVVRPLQQDAGGCQVQIFDRTPQAVRESKLHEQATQLSAINEELKSFTSVVSHDLKAPLRGIGRLIAWMSEDPDNSLSEKSKAYAEQLGIRASRLSALIDGMLEYARAGRLGATVESVDSAALCGQIVDYLQPPAGFSIIVGEGLPALETVKAALETVLRNLIGNALKHHDAAGGEIAVSASDEGDSYRFVVADDGPGIARADQERIFQMYQTVPRPGATETSGMGLAIVKRLVQSAGGRITVESREGRRGTAFCFTWKKVWPGKA